MKKIITLCFALSLMAQAYPQISKTIDRELINAKDSIEGAEIHVYTYKGTYSIAFRNYLYPNITVYASMYFTNKVMLKNTILTVKKMYADNDPDSKYSVRVSSARVLQLVKTKYGTVFLMDPAKNTACEIPKNTVEQILSVL